MIHNLKGKSVALISIECGAGMIRFLKLFQDQFGLTGGAPHLQEVEDVGNWTSVRLRQLYPFPWM
jgi:hypothetical protein